MTVASTRRPPTRSKAAQGSLEKRLAAMEARLARMQRHQDEQFLRMMKFTILRHMSVLSFAIEHGGASREAKVLAKRWLDEGTQGIAEAQSLDELKQADVEMQRKVRQLLAGVQSGDLSP